MYVCRERETDAEDIVSDLKNKNKIYGKGEK